MTQSNLEFLQSLINVDSTNPPANENNVVKLLNNGVRLETFLLTLQI